MILAGTRIDRRSLGVAEEIVVMDICNLAQQFVLVSWMELMWLKLAGSRSVSSAMRPLVLAECSRFSIVLLRQTSSRTCSSRLPEVQQTHVLQSSGTMLGYDLSLLLYVWGYRGCWTFAILWCSLVADWLSSWLMVGWKFGELLTETPRSIMVGWEFAGCRVLWVVTDSSGNSLRNT